MNAMIARLDKQTHKVMLMSLLLDISKNEILKKSLVFKWWTALFLLYHLDRFSTDLDFDLIGDISKEAILSEVIKIASKYGNVTDSFIKRNTIFAIVSYGDIEHNIKIEISTRGVSWKYALKNIIWITLPVLDIEFITANKFLALTMRDKIANRDIYDIHFILKNHFGVDKQHIENISLKSFEEYIRYMIEFLEKLWDTYNILDWLWNTLDEKQKLFVKKSLLQETIFLLHSFL